MSATTIDLRLSRALAPRAFDVSKVGDLTLLDADEATTGTVWPRPGTSGVPVPPTVQKWRVARMHLTEELGELFRCELLIVRSENVRTDPSLPKTQNTMFDDIGNALDDNNRTDSGPGGRPDDLQSIDDRLWGAGSPGAAVQALQDAWGVGQRTSTLVQQRLQNQGVEQYLLGIPPPTPWSPEVPPKPDVFLNKLYSVLATRVGQGNSALVGRWVTGLVTEFEDLGVTAGGHRIVRLVIEPQLARLALRTNHRVFQGEYAMDIVKTIFRDASIYEGDFLPPTRGAKRAFCIQYGETDLELVMRLFSEEGLVPVFEQQLASERIHLIAPVGLSQGVDGFGMSGSVETLDPVDVPRANANELQHASAANAANEEVLWDFTMTRTLAPTAVSIRSIDFSTSFADHEELPTHVREGDDGPDATLAAHDLAVTDAANTSVHLFPGRTCFEFDPKTAVQTDAVRPGDEARLELIAARSHTRVGRGRSNAVGLSVGQRVSVTDGQPLVPAALFDDDMMPLGSFLLTGLEVLAENDAQPTNAILPPVPDSFASPAGNLGLESLVQAMPANDFYLPPRRRAPRIDGVHTAITRSSPIPWKEGNGRLGVDPLGRVRASLPWDRREPIGDEQPLSPPIRLATPWAGHAWGTTFLPREGMELLLSYVDGDPKQPVALGCLHGYVNPAPRERAHIGFVEDDNHIAIDDGGEKGQVVGKKEGRLHYDPDKQKRPVGDRHLNAIRTDVHPAPKHEPYKAFHELSFDDTPGRERVRLHSAGVLEETVENDQRTWVGRDQMNVVQGTQQETVNGNATLIVDGDRTKIVAGHEDREVLGRQDVTVKGMKTLHVRKNLTRHVGTEEASEDLHRIGLEKGDGVRRLLESRRDRKTIIEGDDERTVGGDVDVTCGETYELGGAPLDMKSTAKGENGAGLSTDSELGETTLDGAEGECELIADGEVKVEADTIDLTGATSVRLECGEVSVELSAAEVVMRAPGGVSFFFAGRSARGAGESVPATSSSLVMEAAGGGDIVLKLSDNTVQESDGGGRFEAVFRPGEKGGDYLDAEDALEGGPGVKIAPVDSFVIEGGISAFKCRRVEMQRGDGPKHVHRDMTTDEVDLLNEIDRLKTEIDQLEKDAHDAMKERDAAREDYLAAAAETKRIEDQIKADDGIDEDLAGAIDGVTAAEKKLQKAKRAERDAQDAYRQAFETGQNTKREEEILEDARDDVEDADRELQDAEEELEETREEHGGLMDQYVAARDEEEKKAQALYAAQDEVVRTQNALRAKERELEAAERRASDLELPPEGEEEAAQ